MLLNVRDRIQLNGILPAEGDFRTMKTISQLRDSLFLSEQEVKELNFKQEDMRATWSAEKDKGVEIPVGELAHEVIVAVLKNLDSEKKLTVELLGLWERFVDTKV